MPFFNSFYVEDKIIVNRFSKKKEKSKIRIFCGSTIFLFYFRLVFYTFCLIAAKLLETISNWYISWKKTFVIHDLFHFLLE